MGGVSGDGLCCLARQTSCTTNHPLGGSLTIQHFPGYHTVFLVWSSSGVYYSVDEGYQVLFKIEDFVSLHVVWFHRAFS